MDDYNVLVKIIGEIAYFIGLNEEDNECLGYSFCKIFENCLGNLVNDNFDRDKIFDYLEKIIVMIDEMLDNGLVVNTDPDSLDKSLFLFLNRLSLSFVAFLIVLLAKIPLVISLCLAICTLICLSVGSFG